MPDPFRGYQPGDPAPNDAGSFNAFALAAKMARDRNPNLSAPELSRTRRCDVVRVRNESGRDLTRYSVLGLDAPIILPSDSEAGFLRDCLLYTSDAADE